MNFKLFFLLGKYKLSILEKNPQKIDFEKNEKQVFLFHKKHSKIEQEENIKQNDKNIENKGKGKNVL